MGNVVLGLLPNYPFVVINMRNLQYPKVIIRDQSLLYGSVVTMLCGSFVGKFVIR